MKYVVGLLVAIVVMVILAYMPVSEFTAGYLTSTAYCLVLWYYDEFKEKKDEMDKR